MAAGRILCCSCNLNSQMATSMPLRPQSSHAVSQHLEAWSPGKLLGSLVQVAPAWGESEKCRTGLGSFKSLGPSSTLKHLPRCFNSSVAHTSFEGEKPLGEAGMAHPFPWEYVTSKLADDDCFCPADLLFLQYSEVLIKEQTYIGMDGQSVEKHLNSQKPRMRLLWFKTERQQQ